MASKCCTGARSGLCSLDRVAVKIYKAQESKYDKYLTSDEVKSASAVMDD